MHKLPWLLAVLSCTTACAGMMPPPGPRTTFRRPTLQEAWDTPYLTACEQLTVASNPRPSRRPSAAELWHALGIRSGSVLPSHVPSTSGGTVVVQPMFGGAPVVGIPLGSTVGPGPIPVLPAFGGPPVLGLR